MTANNLPAGPITFLFSDIEGSTQLWDRHAQGMRRALARHDDILRAVVAEHGGAVVKMTGDGAYAVFAKAAHAYAAAVALQRRLQNNTWPAIEPDALSVRVGIHSGEAELREGDYHGQAVNTASRLMAAGHGGQVLVSGETLRAAPPPEQFLTRELGRYRLKGISEPLRIVQLNAPGLPDAFPALNAPRTAVHNLPSLPTPFIGREGELAQIAHFLSEPDCRLLTLLGPGGMGKTRLALRTGAVVSDQYDHGVYFVDLQAVSRTEFLGPAITSAIGFPLNGQEDALVQLSRYLQDKRLLLILDNFEQLVPDRGSLFLAALLDAAPPIQLLVTSREALNLQQEWLYYVPGLSLPDTPAAEDAEAESVQLFNERARRVRPEFSAQSERAHVTAICRLVEGVPLALELAASWTRLLTCEQIAAELASSFDLLATDRHNVPDRQQSLRVVFDQTWRHLTEDEQAAFMKLSIFHGGFSYDAARQVAGAPLPLLSTLQDKSLIRWDENGRYRIHELLRQYAARKLAQAPSELETAQERHGRYYIDFLERHEQPLMDGRQVQAVQEIKAELENVRAAWQWALEKLDSDAVRRASYALGNFYQFHSRYAEALRAFEPASTRLYSLAQSRERDLALIGTLMVRSWFYLRFGRLDEITEAMEQSQALHQR
ncbi:MAG: adenylate/guanylate cyclase domain-containing protein, partial [Candidatus Promineifilaceae bacterium]